MNTKKNIGLFILLLVQAALIVYLYQPGRNAAPPSAPLFNGLNADNVRTLSITDDSAKSVRLTKTATGWTVGDNNYPADGSKIKGIIERISKLKNSRLISRSKGSHSRLKVGKEMFKRRVTMTGSAGKDITFFLGSSPSAKAIYLRRAGDNDVYEVSGLTAWQLQTDNDSWWQTKYISIDQAKLQSLTIKGKEDISLSRNAKGGWQLAGAPAGSKLDKAGIRKLLDTISEISITGYKAPDFAPHGKAVATITYKTTKKFNLQIWPKKDKKADEQIIKTSAAKFYAGVSSYVLRDVLALKRADLLTKPKP